LLLLLLLLLLLFISLCRLNMCVSLRPSTLMANSAACHSDRAPGCRQDHPGMHACYDDESLLMHLDMDTRDSGVDENLLPLEESTVVMSVCMHTDKC
jgi:hypothetical protein